MTHIMVDLETLSTKCNAMILAIGAVKFDAERGVYDIFYQAVKTPAEVEGFHVSADTLNWWAQQSDEARAVFTDPDAVAIDEALDQFHCWAEEGENIKDIKLWGNGAAFDNAILSTAYDLCGRTTPWMFYNDRCYRTMKATNRDVPFTRVGTHHNAVDDAESQALHLIDMRINLR